MCNYIGDVSYYIVILLNSRARFSGVVENETLIYK